MVERAAILEGARTPFGRLGGALAQLTAPELGGIAIRGAMDRSGIDCNSVEGAILGIVLGAGVGQVPSRQATAAAGLPCSVTSETVNRVCGSGMRVISLAEQLIRLGDYRVLVAGGMESMSNAPYLLDKARFGYRMGNGILLDSVLCDGLQDPFEHVHVGEISADFADRMCVTREEQDRWALQSHQRAIAARDAGRLGEEIVPVEVRDSKGRTNLVERDEGPRDDTSLDKLAALTPVFRASGTITAGNSPGVNDGAAAVVVVAESFAVECGQRPLAYILSHAVVGDRPDSFPATPPAASLRALSALGLSPLDVDLWEINEAFASVAVYAVRELGIDPARVNVNGGAVAFGHPIGASGTRIVLTLALELRRRGGGLGVATICSGTGQGDAIVIEVPRANP